MRTAPGDTMFSGHFSHEMPSWPGSLSKGQGGTYERHATGNQHKCVVVVSGEETTRLHSYRSRALVQKPTHPPGPSRCWGCRGGWHQSWAHRMRSPWGSTSNAGRRLGPRKTQRCRCRVSPHRPSQCSSTTTEGEHASSPSPHETWQEPYGDGSIHADDPRTSTRGRTCPTSQQTNALTGTHTPAPAHKNCAEFVFHNRQ